MGLGGISIWQLLIVLVIVLLLFGTKKLKNIGADLGGAVKGFRSAMMGDGDDEKVKEGDDPPQITQAADVPGEAHKAEQFAAPDPAATRPPSQPASQAKSRAASKPADESRV